LSDDDPLAPYFEEGDGREPEPGEHDNAADPRRIRRRETKIQRDKREADEFWRSVFASEVGRREMWGILLASGFTAERFGAGPTGFPDPNATWFRLGVQTVARELLEGWEIRDHEGVYLMRCEHDPKYFKAKTRPKREPR
jgi:hypothetical protein